MSTRPQPLASSHKLGFGKVKPPRLPGPPERPKAPLHFGDYDLPDDARKIVEYIEGEGVALLQNLLEKKNYHNVWALGLGKKEVTGEFCATYLVQAKQPKHLVKKGCLLPTTIGDGIPTNVIERQRKIHLLQTPCPAMTGVPSACGGASITNSPVPNGGGSLCGSWQTLLGGGSQRGMVNTHVALGFGFLDFIAALPGSITWLFDSPDGEDIFTNSLGAPDNFRIMEIDTSWPILAPLFTAIPGLGGGGTAFVYLDSAAGDFDFQPPPANPLFLPPPPPPQPPRVGGLVGPPARIRTAQAPLPGTEVYKIGTTTFRTWGEISLAFLVIPIAIGPIVVLFDQVLCDLDISPGDSGAPVLTADTPTQTPNHFIAHAWGGLPPMQQLPGTLLLSNTLATPAHQIWWRMNLDMF